MFEKTFAGSSLWARLMPGSGHKIVLQVGGIVLERPVRLLSREIEVSSISFFDLQRYSIVRLFYKKLIKIQFVSKDGVVESCVLPGSMLQELRQELPVWKKKNVELQSLQRSADQIPLTKLSEHLDFLSESFSGIKRNPELTLKNSLRKALDEVARLKQDERFVLLDIDHASISAIQRFYDNFENEIQKIRLRYQRFKAQDSSIERYALPLLSRTRGMIRELKEGPFIRSGHRGNADSIDRTLQKTFTELKGYLDNPASGFFSNQDALDEIAYFLKYTKSTQDLIQEANANIIQRELEKHREYFDTIEKHPLTDKQRKACVINDASNLVLAGAGTGKTSVILGRIGYLLRAKLAKPDQILALAYNSKAAMELTERCQDRLLSEGVALSDLSVKTFHAFGLDVIASVEGKKPSLSKLSESKARFAKFANEFIQKNAKDEQWFNALVTALDGVAVNAKSIIEFSSINAYSLHRQTAKLITLRGEEVKSLEEQQLANFLCYNNIAYEYEKPYEHDTGTSKYRRYEPDFYLPEYGVYIEHFGINRQGETAPFINNEQYQIGMQWKRNLHKEQGTVLIETYSYEFQDGSFRSSLQEKLEANGIELSPLSREDRLELVRDRIQESELTEFIRSIILGFKAIGVHPRDFHPQDLEDPVRFSALINVVTPFFDAYEAELAASNQIDFDDMIHLATSYIKNKKYKVPFRHVLIDEFQDISRPRANLVESLLNARPEAALFAVGDDWQAIYRFAGSDIRYVSDFGGAFGAFTQVSLDKTFRYNSKILDIAHDFIQKNPAQLNKNIASITEAESPKVSLIRADSSFSALKAVVRKISGLEESASLAVLSRTNSSNDAIRDKLRQLMKRHRNIKVDLYSVHKSKGLEADYVFIHDVNRGMYGFPSEKESDPFLELLTPKEPETTIDYPEERRLFYVALTRAKKKVFISYNAYIPSSFVEELASMPDLCLTDEFNDEFKQRHLPTQSCPSCKEGTLKRTKRSHPIGNRSHFMSCSNYPVCDYAEDTCPKCDDPMIRTDSEFKICASCFHAVPVCGKCGGEMVLRTNKKKGNTFYGCRNFYSKTRLPCTSTKNHISWPNHDWKVAEVERMIFKHIE